MCRLSWNLRASTSRNPRDSPGLWWDCFTFTLLDKMQWRVLVNFPKVWKIIYGRFCSIIIIIIIITVLITVLKNSYYKLYYKRSITSNRTVRNNRPDTVMLDKTVKLLLQHHQREVPEIHRYKTRARKDKTTESSPHITISIIHYGHYPKQITRQSETAQSSP